MAYKTAWYLCHRIREAMGNDPFDGPTLLGIVEVDETLVGGKTRGKGRALQGKQNLGCRSQVQRNGGIKLERIPNTKKGQRSMTSCNRTVKDEAEAIYTDELASYLGIADHNTRHETVQPFRRAMGSSETFTPTP